jgi:carboxypeptidase Taq
MDDAVHPFCEGIGPGDTRLTNRYRPDGWLDQLSSATHEAGHGMYEQGVAKGEHFGMPLGEAVSLGIHESQSRMWENQIGRSREFWEWGIGVAREVFGDALKGVDAETVFRVANIVEPHFIRVESDEVTYNLHIMLRFDMERAMIAGDLNPKDLPGVWNERMKKDQGLIVKEDRLGCLQDIHWSMGAVGYFATYSLGNIYAAQLWEAMGKAIPDREARVSRGEFGAILSWLRENVHVHGRRYSPEDLCERATGQRLQSDALMRHLDAKVGAVYAV